MKKLAAVLWEKTVAGTFGNVGPLAVILLQTLLERWFSESVLRCDCTSPPVSRVRRTGQQTHFICCAFVQFLCFCLLGILLGLIWTLAPFFWTLTPMKIHTKKCYAAQGEGLGPNECRKLLKGTGRGEFRY